MRKIIGTSTIIIASILAACGGGGGSPGETKLPYSISLKAEKTQLPLNVANLPAGIGAYAPYSTTLYVEGRKGDAPVPGGDDIFGCNVSGGLDSGALYYLDGKSEHQDENGKPNAYRSITLAANSGGNSFHFHAGNKAGTARVTCAVTNPADKQVSSASVEIIVGAATGKPASVIATTQMPGYLGSRGNLAMIRSSVVVQALVMDDANQPVPAPNAANLQVSIRPNTAGADARLLSGAQAGNVLQVRTVGGVGEFSLASGPNTGAIILEFVTDRFDNDVSNGIQDPVVSLAAVGVYDVVGKDPLVITTKTVTDAQVGVPFIAFALEASGGVPPYLWSAVGGLPSGLTLDSSGIIQGIPSAAGTFNVVIRVLDGAGAVSSKNLVITVAPAAVVLTPPAQAPLAIPNCGSATGDCQLPDATMGVQYPYAFSATGGDTSLPIVWTFSPATPSPGLSTATAGNDGVISGTPTTATPACARFVVTATRGSLSVSRTAAIRVNGGVCPA